MTEQGMLSTMQCGNSYQVHDASSNPYGMDHQPSLCPDEGILVTLLHHCGMPTWSLQQADAALRQGRVAVVPIVCSEVQRQTFFLLPPR